MKKFKLALVAMTLVMLWSCGKYEEGPAFSLRSKTGRLVGTWELEHILVGGVQQQLSGTSEITFERDGTYTSKIVNGIGSVESTGTWEFGDGKETVKVTFSAPGSSFTIENDILRLTNSEYWMKNSNTNGTETVYHYKAK